jgi:tRNA-specific 2-thiouridylase
MPRKSRKNIVFVAMSGGVDSSVAAYLLKKQGYGVVGVFMRCWSLSAARAPADKDADNRGNLNYECEAERDAEDARRTAEYLKIPFYVWDFEEEYKKRVVNYMIEGYRRGITPNPDVMCNKEIKFGLFFQKALAMGAAYMATGHYVRLSRAETADKRQEKKNKKTIPPVAFYMSLLAARDAQKDQSYFLWTLTQEQLKHCLFPIGDYLKSEVREIARKAGLPTAEKKDSQGICFLGRVRLEDFLSQYIKPKVGQVRLVLPDGSSKVIGEHLGAHFYTIGQRHIGISKSKNRESNSVPIYVAEKDIKTNTLVVAQGSNNPALYKKEIKLTNVNFIRPAFYSNVPEGGGIKVLARVRYRQPLARAKLIFAEKARINVGRNPRAAAEESAPIRVIFDAPQKFVAAGQSAVFYNAKGEMLGGGIIL